MLAVGVLLMFLRDQMLLIVTVNKDWLLQLPPLPLIAVVYAGSLVLLFGGMRLLRAAWFPVLLMWAVIPVPQTFSRRVDVPLQHIGASVARSFAHLIGVHLNVVGPEDHVCAERRHVYRPGMRWAARVDHDGADGDRDCVPVPVQVVHLSAGGDCRRAAGVCVQFSAAVRDGDL